MGSAIVILSRRQTEHLVKRYALCAGSVSKCFADGGDDDYDDDDGRGEEEEEHDEKLIFPTEENKEVQKRMQTRAM